MNPLSISMSWVELVLNCAAPFVLITVMNSLIIKTILAAERSISQKNKHRGCTQNLSDALTPNFHGTTTFQGAGSRAQTKILQGHISREEASYKTHKQSAVLLIVVTSTFLLLTMPLYISYLLFAFIDYEGDLDTRGVLVLIYHIAHKICITNSAINFVLYLFAGTRFRRDFVISS